MVRMLHRGQLALAAFTMGACAIAYGSIVTLPALDRWPGQVVLSILVGAALVLAGAVPMLLLLARRPGTADTALTTPPAAGRALAELSIRAGYGTFDRFPALRWALAAAFAAVAVGALLLLASDAFALVRLGWAVPPGGVQIVVG
jgi:hypothetical protein